MLNEPSLSQTFHELFCAPWPDDDPAFLEEIHRYESAIRRLISIDDQMGHFIQTQPLLDNDQISAIPYSTGVRKVQILASIEPINQTQLMFTLSCSPCNLGKVFSKVVVSTGIRKYEYNSNEKQTDCLKLQFEYSQIPKIQITAFWSLPLVRLSAPLQKFMGSPIGILGEIAQKILAHIDSRNLLLSTDGDVKCDGTLRTITGKDNIMITDISDVIQLNSTELEPVDFLLDLPKSSRAFSIQAPFFPSAEMSDFEPIKVTEPPIKKLLETALESKGQLLLHESFEKNPIDFVDTAAIDEAKMMDISDVTNSTYFFNQPWVLENASDFIKSADYLKNAQKRATQQYRI